VQAEGLQATYTNPDNLEVKIGLHPMLSLAFVRVKSVEASFDILLDELPEELVDAAVKYYTN